MNYKIKVPFDNVDKILHVADIHIRNYSRHKEYRIVFDKLYAEVDKLPVNSIVYVGGDIVHSKTDISPELIDLTTEFLSNLADRRTTIVITGNHDANLNNSSRLDTLSPIIAAIDHPELHYLKDSGIYKIADINFVVFGIFDEPNTYIKADSFQGTNKIALFHGAVDNSMTDIGFKVKNDNLPLSLFEGYDMGMLGDIHKRQFYNENKTILQVGSLLQQNIGESVDKHGCAVWDVSTRVATFTDFSNEYSQHKVEIDNGVIVSDTSGITKHSKIRLLISNSTQAQIQSVISELKSIYPSVEIGIKRNATDEEKENRKRSLVKDINDVGYQNTLIEDYLTTEHSVSPDIIEEVRRINNELNGMLVSETSPTNQVWEPKMFEFSNMFSYGEGNQIDFSKMEHVAGIFAPNHAGKSAIFDALMFCLFDRCSRTSSGKDIMNSNKTTFGCKLKFVVDGTEYFIVKKGKLITHGKYPHVNVKIDFYMLDEEGEKVSLNGEQRKDTNRNISNIVGEYDDFILTAMSAQNNNSSFIDKSQSDKKKLLARYTDVQVLEDLYELGKEEVKSVKVLLKDFGKHNYSELLNQNESDLVDLSIKYDAFEKEMVELESLLSVHQNNLDEKKKQLKPVSKVLDIDSLKSDLESIQDKKDAIQLKLDEYNGYVAPNETNIKQADDNLLTYNIEDITDRRAKLTTETITNNDLNNQISVLKVKVKTKLDTISKLDTHEYDPDCKYCCNNEFVKLAEQAKVTLEDDKVMVAEVLAKKELSDLKLTELNGVLDDLDNFNSWTLQRSRYKRYQSEIEVKMGNCLLNIEKANTLMKATEADIAEYSRNEDAIIHNKKIQTEVDLLRELITEAKVDVNECRVDIQTTYGITETTKQTISNIQKLIEDAHRLEIKLKAFDFYLLAMHRDGISYEIISNLMPIVEDEVNEILEQIVDFTIEFNVDGKNIVSYICYGKDKWPLSITSGMEKFLSSLAIRVALTKVSCLPRPNFLIIDEGFGNLDSENLQALESLFEYLKTEYDFIMVVSHIDLMKDMVDELIEIDTTSGHSLIQY